MRLHLARVARWAAMSLGLLFLLHIVNLLTDDASVISKRRPAAFSAQSQGEEQQLRSVQEEIQRTLEEDKQKTDEDGSFPHHQGVVHVRDDLGEEEMHEERDNWLGHAGGLKDRDVGWDSANRLREVEEEREVEEKKEELEEEEEEEKDKVEAETEDPNADVTFPPYVESAPAGQKGAGPEGLTLNKYQLSEEQRAAYERGWKANGFNQLVSDLIPVHRYLPDYRSKACQEKQYPPEEQLPTVSVVMVFHNEAWSMLLRSVHSVLNTAPSRLLLHVILVDDFSSMAHLKRPLDKYFHGHPKVKIIRSPERGGLIKARLRGFNATTGEVVVFLDSHVECTKGWAEPLLWMIKENERSVPFPTVDLILSETMAYHANHISPYGVFGLNTFTFRWDSGLRRPRPVETEPMASPTMPGGLFAISRRWFSELGTYDPQLDFWGGENLELSFKAWMCGGRIVVAQCSHVGHVYRSRSPITWPLGPVGVRNYVRVALVWLDDYRNHYLERIHYHLGDYGDISGRVALRQRLQCRSFSWYVDNVYPELKEQIVLNATYAGQVMHEESGLCLDRIDSFRIYPSLYPCHMQGGNQFWYLREGRYLQIQDRYLCQVGNSSTVRLCPSPQNQEWSYDPMTRQLTHVQSDTCLQKRDGKSKRLVLLPCQRSSQQQQTWTLQRRQEFKYR